MREIKFRCWDNITKKFSYIVANGGAMMYHELNLGGSIHDLELMQFIGLFDKNKKEIYEGDILKATWGNDNPIYMFVAYQAPEFILKQKKTSKAWSTLNEAGEIQTLWEVTGNLYENPELLK